MSLLSINLILIFAPAKRLCSTMDSMWVSGAYDPGSIPGKATTTATKGVIIHPFVVKM